MKNHETAERLRAIADYLESEDVAYKPRAYRTAARNVESLSEPVEAVHERGELQDVEGVGESIAESIAEYLETGSIEQYEHLEADLPVDMAALTSVEGVGPKTARRLYRELGVATLEDLERAAEAGEIAELEGFGAKSEHNIRERVGRAKRGQERMLLGRALPIARAVESRLQEAAAFDRVDLVGSVRRRRPTVGDVDVLATAADAEAAMGVFCTHEDVEEVLARGETKASVRVASGLRLDLRIVDEPEYGAAFVYFTGSKDHNIALRNRAIDRGWKLNEYGLFDVSDPGDGSAGADGSGSGRRGGDRIAGETEADVYDALDLSWIPPALREDIGEVDAAAAGDLPELVEPGDIRGDLQAHTDFSDGSHTVREMAVAADERGLSYLLLTDHGPHAPIPTRLDAEAFDEQRAAVDAVNDNDDLDVTVLQGVEAEVTERGLETPASVLEHCDVVVAGLHSAPSEPTERVLSALREPAVDVFAHPTGRLINEREPLDLDLDRIAAAAADEGVALEINAQPERLDLDWESVKAYRDAVRYVVSTDAHTTGELDLLDLGVSQARRGWCEAGDVLNTRPLEDVLSFFD